MGPPEGVVRLYYSEDRDIYQFNIWQIANGQGHRRWDPTHAEDFSAFPFALEAHSETTDTAAEFGRLSYGLLDDRLTLAAELRHSSDDLTFTDTIAKITQEDVRLHGSRLTIS